MDFHMKQENKQQVHESETQQYPFAKMPKLDLLHHHSSASASAPALPLSPFSDGSKLPRIGSYFSLGQWQELELQALIYRYMLAGASVPPDLLHSIHNSLLLSHSSAPPYFLHHPLHHFQPALLQSGYWGRLAMDPEPGRCRRTDGKKWRCSKDVVGGHKYCDRHMHRGRNRSRKPVETPTSSSSTAAPIYRMLNFTQSCAHPKHEVSGNDTSDAHILRHFFDDWPRPIQEADGSGSNGTGLSISPSDVSLKLSTGVGNGEDQPQLNWGSMGGPLAEALRSSISASSPTTVLHHLPPNSLCLPT